MRIGALSIHRKEQWDYNCWPIVCIHRRSPNVSQRIFCLWVGGLQIGKKLWTWRVRAAHPEGGPQ